MPNSVKSIEYTSATARVAPDLLKTIAILSDATVRRSAVDQQDLKAYWKSTVNQISHKIKKCTL